MTVRSTMCVATVLFLAAALPASAIDATRTLLGFGAHYTAPDGSTCTHRGADIAADAGANAASPVSGTVRFAGRVPGPHGGSVGAVTLETDSGTVSILPLEGIGVAKGDDVAAGQTLGRIAESGDPSSPVAHAHVSLRQGDLYLDPAVLFAAAPAPAEPPVAEPAPVPAPAPTPAPAPAPAVRAGATGTLSAAGASGPVGVSSPVSSPGAQAGNTGAVVSMGAGVSIAPAEGVTAAAPVASRAPLGVSRTADVGAAERLGAIASQSALAALGWLHDAGTSGVVAILVSLAVCACLLARRAFEREVLSNPPVSDRLGRVLQQLRAGDTLRGLTSCPGPLPSQSRGRIAQRR